VSAAGAHLQEGRGLRGSAPEGVASGAYARTPDRSVSSPRALPPEGSPHAPVKGGVLSAIYSLLIRRVSYVQYEHLLRAVPEGARVLDVGIGNGIMLDRHAELLRQRGIHLDGIDLHEGYLEACRRRVQQHGLTDLVTCRCTGVEALLESDVPLPPYVYFSASFMLLPNPERVLQLLYERLPENGTLLFTQTLYRRQNRFIEWVKPRLKYLTTIDFGRAQYRDSFVARLERHGFRLVEEKRLERVSGNQRVYYHAFRRVPRAG